MSKGLSLSRTGQLLLDYAFRSGQLEAALRLALDAWARGDPAETTVEYSAARGLLREIKEAKEEG
jgi:hypothetical protein